MTNQNQPDPGQQLLEAVVALMRTRLQVVAEASMSWQYTEAMKVIDLTEQANDKDAAIEPAVFRIHCNNARTKQSWRVTMFPKINNGGLDLESKMTA